MATAALLVEMSPVSVSAQPLTQGAEAAAKKHTKEGLRLVKAGDFEGARVEFQLAHGVSPSPGALRNLGASEVQSGHYVDAARHLSTYFKDARGPAQEIAKVREPFEIAKKHVGMLTFEADVPGTRVVVDEEVVGNAPLESGLVWFVPPGTHQVVGHLDGYEDFATSVTTAPGIETHVNVHVRSRAPAVAAAPLGALETASPMSEPPTENAASVDASHDATKSLKTPVVVGGVVLTVSAAAIGLGYALKSSAALSDAATQREAAFAQWGPPGCNAPQAGGSNACSARDAAVSGYHSGKEVAKVSFVAAGIFGSATAAALLFWPTKSKESGELHVLPHVGVNGAGVSVGSTF